MIWKVILIASIVLLLTTAAIEIGRRPKPVSPLPAPRQRKLLAVTFKGNLESRGDAHSGRLILPVVFLALLTALLLFLLGG